MGSHDSDRAHSDDDKREEHHDAEIHIKISAPRCGKQCRTCCENLFILMFEFTGTFMLTCIWFTNPVGWFDLWIGFFIILIMGANISGAHFNPCVTAAFMFRRDKGKFKALHGFFYILFQILGALMGGLVLCNIMNSCPVITVGKTANNNWAFSQSMFREFIGSVILVFMYLTQTEKKTKLAKDPAITAMIIAGSWIVAMSIGKYFGGPTPVNPALAIGSISSLTLKGQYDWGW